MPQDVIEGPNKVTSRLPDMVLEMADLEMDGQNLTERITRIYFRLMDNESSMIVDMLTAAPTNVSHIGCDGNILQYRIVPALIMAACFVFGVLCWICGKYSISFCSIV